MSKDTVTKSYRGKASQTVSWDALLRVFDALWGKNARSLPSYPEIIGDVQGKWIDSQNTEHKAEVLEEIEQAYKKYETASIIFNSLDEKGLRRFFQYWPSNVKALIEVQTTDRATADTLIDSVRNEFPFVEKYVFVSYDSSEYRLAVTIAEIVEKRLAPGVTVFVAKRDIPAGKNPRKIMLEEQLLQAEALLAICSAQSKKSPWLWWESSAVWARGGLVIPLFVDITPNSFNGPIILVCQGRSIFNKADLNSVLSSLVATVCPGQIYEELTDQELADLKKFQESKSLA